MKISREGDIAFLEEAGDSVCFNAQYPNAVFVPARMRSLLDVFRAGGCESGREDDQEAFNAFLGAHGIHRVALQSHPTESNLPGCACAGQGGQRRSAAIYLLLSHGCNQACIYCLNGRESYGVADCAMMTDAIAQKALLQVASSIAPDGDLEVVFFGGEPLLNWPLAKRLMDWSHGGLRDDFPALKLRFHLTTNLTIFPTDLIDYARKYDMTFLVDVDGPSDIHLVTRPYKGSGNSLADTMRHIGLLRDAELPVALRATVTSHNHERMLEVSRFHLECGGTSSAFVPLNAVDSDGSIIPRNLCPDPQKFAAGLVEVYRSDLWPVEQLHPFNQYEQRFEPGNRMNHGCGAPYGNTPVVTAEGKIFTCIYMVNNSLFEAGDVETGDYPREEVLEWMRDVTDTNRRECRNCVFQYLCGGGCPVGLFGIQRRPDSADWAKRYTREINCAMSQTVLGELLFDRGRATADELDMRLRTDDVLPDLPGTACKWGGEQMTNSRDEFWRRIEKEAIRERETNRVRCS
jgi:uncharacterized protein